MSSIAVIFIVVLFIGPVTYVINKMYSRMKVTTCLWF